MGCPAGIATLPTDGVTGLAGIAALPTGAAGAVPGVIGETGFCCVLLLFVSSKIVSPFQQILLFILYNSFAGMKRYFFARYSMQYAAGYSRKRY